MNSDAYQSPFSGRYGSDAMREIWSEARKRRTWRRIWVALARAQLQAGLVSEAELADLQAHADQVDIARALAIEADIQHDLMAEIMTFAEQATVGGRVLHLGATSEDIKSNSDMLLMQAACSLLETRIHAVLSAFADQIEAHAETICMGHTHLQPAEPTTIGYRLANYAQDLRIDLENLRDLRTRTLKGKGIKGAVGTRASFDYLLRGTGVTPAALDDTIMAELGLQALEIAAQTYPRKLDFEIARVLVSAAQSATRFANDLTLLQAPSIGELAEPFKARQVGSSAMPFKRNPIRAESIVALGKFVASQLRQFWENAAEPQLERRMSDSANRRIALPQMFLALDEMLGRLVYIVEGLLVNQAQIARNLQRYAPFAATEPLLMELVKRGADRQQMHAVIKHHAMAAWEAAQSGAHNPLIEHLAADPQINRFLDPDAVYQIADPGNYVGDAPARATAFAAHLRALLAI